MKAARSPVAWFPIFILATMLALAAPDGARGFEVGADLSWLQRDEDAGAVYRSEGTRRDPVELLAENGFGLVRVRLWHTPTERWNGLESTLEFAERAAGAGCEIMLDLHYSDTWADPGHQTKPAAWEGLGFDALVDSVYAYTGAVLRRFRDRGITPAYVQLGNEVTNGLLWDDGRVGGAWDTPRQWAQLCRILAAASTAVRDSAPGAESPRIVIHVDNGADNVLCRRFYDGVTVGGVDFDIIGLSFYPWWHGTAAELSANMRDLAERYGMQIMVVESAYPWTLAWCDDTHNPVGMEAQLSEGYPATPAGQARYLSDLLARVRAVPGAAALIYWEPAHVCIKGGPGSSWENLALFDFDGDALLGLAFARSETAEGREATHGEHPLAPPCVPDSSHGAAHGPPVPPSLK